MDEVREVVDIDLGITDRGGASATGANLQAFLYISNANKVIASAFVEHIEKVPRPHSLIYELIKSQIIFISCIGILKIPISLFGPFFQSHSPYLQPRNFFYLRLDSVQYHRKVKIFLVSITRQKLTFSSLRVTRASHPTNRTIPANSRS